jgi:hypothetical protein
MDSATEIRGQARPSVGDISLCINCGEVLEFDKEMNLHVASLTALVSLSPRNHHDIELAQKLIRKQERNK